jgi:hypothetical protein
MRGRAETVEDPGRAEQQGAGAHGRGPTGRPVGPLDPGDELVVALVARPGSSRDDHDVELGNVAQTEIGGQRQGARVGALRPALSGDEEDLGAWQAAQHLVGPDSVERGQSVECERGAGRGWDATGQAISSSDDCCLASWSSELSTAHAG